MKLSLEEAIAMFNKWKDERAPLFVFGQNVFQTGLRNVHEGGVDWNISLRGVTRGLEGHVREPGRQFVLVG